MKIGRGKKGTFNPVKLELTFENKKELDYFYALLNFTPIVSWLNIANIDSSEIRDELRENNDGVYPSQNGTHSNLMNHLKNAIN